MISVIIPVYNAESTLRKCLLSIAAQTYADLQVIAVNDGSTDNSENILKEFCKNDKRFCYYNRGHAGASHARNEGLKYATGDYLQFTDADDELAPEMFERLISLMEKNDCELAICRFEHPFFKCYVNDAVYDLSDKNDLLRLYSETFSMIMPWNKVWRRSCFTVQFDEDVAFSEDELCNLGNLPNIKRVVTCSEYLYRYFFAKKEEAAEENSCINTIINELSFWKNKTSFYYKGASILNKRRKYIESAIFEGKLSAECADDLAYLRLIDYCFWQMPAYIGMNIPEEGLAEECENIFKDKDFVDGFKAQEKFGFKIKRLEGDELKSAAEKFTSLCYKIYAEKNDDENFKVAFAFISVFLKMFAEVCGELNDVNQNVRLLLDLQNNSTPEAVYVNEIC